MMAESIEVLSDKNAENPDLPNISEAKHNVTEGQEEGIGVLVEGKSTEKIQSSGTGNESNHENKQKKKKKKPKPVLSENTIIAYTEIHQPKETQNSQCEQQMEKFPLDHRQQVILLQHRVEPRRATPKSPRGRFYCTLCNYYCDSWYILENHIATVMHVNSLEDFIDHESIKLIPAPLIEQINVISDLLKKNNSLNGIDKVNERKEILVRFEELIKRAVSGCAVKMFGSSEYKAGLTSSNVNLNVTIPTTQDRASTMLAVYKHMKDDNTNIRNVNFNMSQDVPAITFEDVGTDLQCRLSFNNNSACEVAHLLRKYLMLDERALELARAFRFWAHLCCLDQIDSGTLPAHVFPILVIYYLQQLGEPVLPVLDEHEIHEEESAVQEVVDSNNLRKKKWKTKNKKSIGELWLGLFRFYLVEFDVYEKVVSIKTKDSITQSSKKWSTRRLSIEDPVAPHRNVARSMINSKTLRYFMSCLRTSFLYFATPQMKMGPIFRRVQNLPPGMTEMTHLLVERENFLNFISRCHPCFLSDQELNQKKSNELIDPSDLNFTNIGKFIVTPEQALFLFRKFNSAYLLYNFSRKCFAGEKVLPLVCVYCREEGHYKDKCPEESLPPLEKLPVLPRSYMKKLSIMCEALCETWALTPSELAERENIVHQLHHFLKQSFPDVTLTLFGSSCNGFGLKQSDVDICFTFMTCPPDEELDFTKLIQDLYGILKKYSAFGNLVPITTAKVPILKFFHCETKLDGDISFHNTLALRNTSLIQTYSNIDARAKVLGYVVKRFAKICNICDASKGSLSSYAYILLMIHFLQQCDPPVLPVLQEIDRPQSTDKYVVENWDTYFFDDVDKLRLCWEEYGKNDKTIGELWIEFLCFYTEVHNFAEYIISIRTKQPVTRFEKVWHSKSMAIEDPFDLTHNLGNGLSPKMHQFILKAFRNGRSYFTCVENLPDNQPYSKAAEKYFEASKVKGTPPDRGCHNCKKLGHIAKDCPTRHQRRESSSEARDHQRNKFAQSPKSAKPQINMKKNNIKGNFYRDGSWQEGVGPWNESYTNHFGYERGRNTKGNANNNGGPWQEGSKPWSDTNDQKVGPVNYFKNDKGRKSTWWNKVIPNAIPVTPLISTPTWNTRPIPLQNVQVPPEIQVRLDAIAKKWKIDKKCQEPLPQKEREIIVQPPRRFTGQIFDVYTRPSDVPEISSVEFHNKAAHYPSNFQG